MKKKAKSTQSSAPPSTQPQNSASKPEVRWFENSGKAKTTRWERSSVSLIIAILFLLLGLWYLLFSSRGGAP